MQMDDTSAHAADPPQEEAPAPLPPPPEPVDYSYSCRVCRHDLFKESELVPHSSDRHAAGNKQFRRKGGAIAEDAEAVCTSYFLDPFHSPWVGEEAQQAAACGAEVLPDTIYCPHCRTKLGTQSWTGTQCSCGAWVTPAFKILSKCVDRTPIYAP